MQNPSLARRSCVSAASGALVAAALLARPTPARAQATTAEARAVAARRELLSQAQTAREAGNHLASLEAASRALELQATPSVRVFVAVEQLAVRRFAEAYANARLCQTDATRDPTLRNRESILAECQRIEADALMHVGYVNVRFPPGTEALAARSILEVHVNGALVPQLLWGHPFAVDEGDATITVTRDGSEIFLQRVRVDARDTVPVAVPPDALRTVGSGRFDAPPVTAPRTGDDDLAPPSGPAVQHAGPGVGPWVLLGAGGGAAVLGAVLYGVSYTLARCPETPDGVCETEARAREVSDGAAPLAITGDALMVAGGLAAAGGIVWAIAAPRGPRTERASRGNLHGIARVEPGALGLRLRFW